LDEEESDGERTTSDQGFPNLHRTGFHGSKNRSVNQ
jgi:hypothetical protein